MLLIKNVRIMQPSVLYCVVITGYLCLSQLTFAQQNAQKYYPECVPVNPEAAGMIKAINYPVSYNTGIPEIGIPLYEVKSRSISIPITLQYHAGGFKAREVAPTTGLGWNLSTNFQIVREIHGFDDFWKSASGYGGYYYNNYGITDALLDNTLYTSQRLCEMANGSIDSQPDRFYYNILGKSGSFYLSKQRYNRIFLPVPYNGVSIACTFSSGNTSSVDFKITDTDGTEYNFTIAEITSDCNYQIKAYESAWKCTSIVSPDRRDTVRLAYQALRNEYSYLDEEYTELYEDLNGLQGQPGLSYGGTVFADKVKLKAYDSYTNVLKKFAFFNLSVPRAINYSMGRDAGLIMYTKDLSSDYKFKTDRFGQNFDPLPTNAQLQTRYVISNIKTSNMTINLHYDTTDQYLKLMQITDAHNRRIRNFYFDQTLVGNYASKERTDRTNYLDAIRIVDAESKTITYSFEYSSKHAFANYTKGGNYWGGINSWTVDRRSYGFGTTVPAFEVTTKYYQTNNYKDYIDNFKIWVGGEYLSSVMMHNRPELRYSLLGQLKKITYPTGGYTEFIFGANYGHYIDNPSDTYQTGGVRIDEIQNFDTDGTLKNKKVYKYGENGEGIPNGIYYYSPETVAIPFCYKQEVEYFVNPVFESSHASASIRGILETKTTYLANILENMNYSNGAPVYYKKVIEYDYSASGENGKKEYIYTNPDKFGYFLHRKRGDTNILAVDESWRLGRLEQENTYRSVSPQVYSLIHSVTHDYDNSEVGRRIHTDIPFRRRIAMAVYVNDNHDQYSHAEITDPSSLVKLGGNYVELCSQKISTGAVYPIKKTETSYDGGRACSVVTQYQYDSYFQPTLTTVTYSDGRKSSESISYAHHFSENSPFIQKMKSRNQIGVPVKIEQRSSGGSNVTTGGILRLFRADNPAQIEQIYVLAPGSQTPSFTEAGLTIPTGYYRKASFSYDALGNLVSRMTNDEPAIVYLWGYDNQYPIAEIKNSDYQTVCNALGSSVVTTLQSSYDSADIRKQIQALRSHASMKDAQVRTFTYTPLFGVTEIIEADGLKTGYIYDGSARLREVTGPDGNRVSRNEYQYVH